MPSGSGVPGQETVEMVGKILSIPLAEGGRATGIDAAGTHSVEEIAHIQPGTNVFSRVHFAARAQRVAAFLDDLGGERDIAGDNEITGGASLYDFIVCDVETPGHLHRTDKIGVRRSQGLVRHEH
jgi:hypothetical protein